MTLFQKKTYEKIKQQTFELDISYSKIKAYIRCENNIFNLMYWTKCQGQKQVIK